MIGSVPTHMSLWKYICKSDIEQNVSFLTFLSNTENTQILLVINKSDLTFSESDDTEGEPEVGEQQMYAPQVGKEDGHPKHYRKHVRRILIRTSCKIGQWHRWSMLRTSRYVLHWSEKGHQKHFHGWGKQIAWPSPNSLRIGEHWKRNSEKKPDKDLIVCKNLPSRRISLGCFISSLRLTRQEKNGFSEFGSILRIHTNSIMEFDEFRAGFIGQNPHGSDYPIKVSSNQSQSQITTYMVNSETRIPLETWKTISENNNYENSFG